MFAFSNKDQPSLFLGTRQKCNWASDLDKTILDKHDLIKYHIRLHRTHFIDRNSHGRDIVKG